MVNWMSKWAQLSELKIFPFEKWVEKSLLFFFDSQVFFEEVDWPNLVWNWLKMHSITKRIFITWQREQYNSLTLTILLFKITILSRVLSTNIDEKLSWDEPNKVAHQIQLEIVLDLNKPPLWHITAKLSFFLVIRWRKCYKPNVIDIYDVWLMW